jgi:hypothetical protein
MFPRTLFNKKKKEGKKTSHLLTSPDYDSTLKLIGPENSHESLYQSPRRFTGAKEEKRRQH